MSQSPDELENISSTNGSHAFQEVTTMPSHYSVRNPMGRMHPPHPRPTVSLDPRPVVIPILSSVIGFPIVVFALICALRHRAIKLRRRDQLKKLHGGVRSVTLDLPPREKVSYFSGGSSPEISIRDVGDRLESTQTTFAPPTTTSSSSSLKSSALHSAIKRNNSSKNNNHVKFVTPTTTLEASHTMKVDVVLHTIATAAAESVGAGIKGSP